MRLLFAAIFAAVFAVGCAGSSEWRPVAAFSETASPPDGAYATMMGEDILALHVDHEQLPTLVLMRRDQAREGVRYLIRVRRGERYCERSGFVEDTDLNRAGFSLERDGTVMFNHPACQVLFEWMEALRECRQE
jgi:hypothetical protein